jgi:hypothetical protein
MNLVPDSLEPQIRQEIVAYLRKHGDAAVADLLSAIARIVGWAPVRQALSELFRLPSSVVPSPAPDAALDNGAQRIALPMTYSWFHTRASGILAEELAQVCEWAAAAGLARKRVGITLEAQGASARPGSNVPDWKKDYAIHCLALPEVLRAIADLGLWIWLSPWNSNTPGKGYLQSWAREQASANQAFVLDCNRQLLASLREIPGIVGRLLVTPCNEDDAATPPALRSALADLWRRELPASSLMSWGRRESWAAWLDVHPQQAADDRPADSSTVITTDSGIISQLYDGVDLWTADRPNARLIDLVARFARKGAVIACYHCAPNAGALSAYPREWTRVLQTFKAAAKF